ncbi:MAG: hypothetical protein ABL891_18160 [Burkholderiales bacterium]
MNVARQYLAVAVTMLSLLAVGGVAAEPVTFAKDAPLRSEPRFDAAPAAQIKQGTTGDASGKQGPWLNIKTPQATGWALTTDVSFGSGGGAASAGASLGGIFGGGKRQQVSGTSTLGVRGFDKETIGTALGDGGAVSAAQLALLDGYAVTKDDSQSFASGKGLSASTVAY